MYFWTSEDDLHAILFAVSFLAAVVGSVVYWGWSAVFVLVGIVVGTLILFVALSVVAQTVSDWMMRRKHNRHLRERAAKVRA